MLCFLLPHPNDMNKLPTILTKVKTATRLFARVFDMTDNKRFPYLSLLFVEEEDNDDDNKACRAEEIEAVTSSRSGRNIVSLVCNLSFCPVAVGESGSVRPVVTADCYDPC